MNILTENLENPYLKSFYYYLRKNPKKYNSFSFSSQNYFLKKRIEKIKNWSKDENLLQERCLEEMYEIFVKTLVEQNLINLKEFNSLKKLFENYSSDFGFSDIIIFLKCDPDNQFNRLKRRYPNLENDSEFFSEINKKYDFFFDIIKKDYKSIKIFEIDTNDLNELEVHLKVKKILDLYYN